MDRCFVALAFLVIFARCRCVSLSTPPPLPLPPLPSAAQLRWHLGEASFFLHFGPNTFTDSEWGTGQADPSVFRPDALNASQWASAAAGNGFSRLIITAKHHDGFCLWPSAFSNYSVSASPWREGSGDVVGDLAAACRRAGLGLGVYLSPWDRHDPSYGNTVLYNEHYLAQMAELLTRYGEIEEVFLDGAKGDKVHMEYLFETWFEQIHQLQPGAVIFSDAGPDVRWVGDEAGVAGSTCWSLFNTSKVSIGGDNNYNYTTSGDPLGQEWVPAECDVSIRPGWFWHASEQPKNATTLLDIYYKSVGRNCHLLLNVPPNSSGLISEEDLLALKEFTLLREMIFSKNLAEDATITASSTRGDSDEHQFSPSNVLQDNIYSYWAPDDGDMGWAIELDLGSTTSFNVLRLQEPIQMGQRVIKFHAEVLMNGEWQTIIFGTTIGYKRLLRFPAVQTQFLRLFIDSSRADPLIAFFGIHMDPFSMTYNTNEIKTAMLRNDSGVVTLAKRTDSGNASAVNM